MELINTLMKNWSRFCEESPDIKEAIQEGYEIGVYDEETGLIMTHELEGTNLKVRIIEEAYIIKNIS